MMLRSATILLVPADPAKARQKSIGGNMDVKLSITLPVKRFFWTIFGVPWPYVSTVLRAVFVVGHGSAEG
jgi:hypothetical protein